MQGEMQPVKRTPVVGVIKDAPAQLNLGSLNDPLPAAYANAGLYVTVQQTGWQSLDGRTFRVSTTTPGTPSNPPRITLEGSDVTHEAEPSIPRSDAFVEIRQTPNNFARY